jgi:uncharacterized SAM-binding protein YcdF (DUF218 family)
MGHDALPRLATAAQLMLSGDVREFVVSGGRHDPPEYTGAAHAHRAMLGIGLSVDPDKLTVESESQNTHEQAVNVIGMALKKNWRNLLLVASPYHIPRAMLTFIQELVEQDATEKIRLIPVPASATRWSDSPDGMAKTRMQLIHDEFRKIDEYNEVAPFHVGVNYLNYWEQNG